MSKVNVIIGGSTVLGRAIAGMLPKDETIVLTERMSNRAEEEAAKLNASGYHAVTISCDVTNRFDVRKTAEEAANLGEIVKVFNCSGISGSAGNRGLILRNNALGTVYINQEFFKVMNGGVICNIASGSGYMLPENMLPSEEIYRLALDDEEEFFEKMCKKARVNKDEETNAGIAYLISKNFVRWYAQHCAYKYMAEKNIRVFSVSPGLIQDPDMKTDKSDNTMISYTALNRGAKPEEVAFLVISLADERCGYFVGADVLCDGGCVNNGYNLLSATKVYDKHAMTEKW